MSGFHAFSFRLFGIIILLALVGLVFELVFLNLPIHSPSSSPSVPITTDQITQNTVVEEDTSGCSELRTLSGSVDGNSMIGIVLSGQIVSYSSGIYQCGVKLHRNDIVVIALGKQMLIKRVIALGGDTWSYSGGVIMVNGTRVTTSTGIPYNIKSPLLERIAKDAPQVPKDTFLAFGNVPSGSFDSSIFGFFDQKSLIGRVLLSKK